MPAARAAIEMIKTATKSATKLPSHAQSLNAKIGMYEQWIVFFCFLLKIECFKNVNIQSKI